MLCDVELRILQKNPATFFHTLLSDKATCENTLDFHERVELIYIAGVRCCDTNPVIPPAILNAADFLTFTIVSRRDWL